MKTSAQHLASISLGVALGVVAACSTLAELPSPRECTEESDCPPGNVCDELLGICRDATNDPPVAYLGFDIVEQTGAASTQFRSEITGCDVEVDIDSTGTRTVTVDRGQVSQTFRLRVFSRLPAETDMPQPSELLAASFELSQPSRLGRSPTPVRRSASHPSYEGEETMVLMDTTLRWPRYHPDNALPEAYEPDGFILWTITPEAPEGLVAPATRYQMLQPPPTGTEEPQGCVIDDGECCPPGEPECGGDDVPHACIATLGSCRVVSNPLIDYNFIYDRNCDRELQGSIVRVDDDLQALGAIPGASFRVRHADVPGEPRLGLPALDDVPIADREPQCSNGAACVEGEQFCNEQTQQCELALTGRNAGRGTSLDDGRFSSRVFTYCKEEPNDGYERGFTINVTPPPDAPLPSMSYVVTAEFLPVPDPEGNQPGSPAEIGNLCVPDWGPPSSLSVTPTGDPVSLLSEYTCCDVSCLPVDRDAADGSPPSSPSRCVGRSGTSAPSVRVSAPLALDSETILTWLAEDSPCAPPLPDGDGVVGTLVRETTCSEQGQCDLDALAAQADGTPRTYQMRIETPPGSLLGSLDTTVDVEPPAVLDPVELPYRRIVRGYVMLPESICRPAEEDDRDCGSKGATVMAERLRMPGENNVNTPGPYVHELPTFYDPDANRDGAYVLPLDRGVWVITALPNAGTQGGPADMVILDLRQGDAVVREDFVLEQGILVTLDVDTYDRSSQVAPLDVGSWRLAGLEHPGRIDLPEPEDRLLDLNARDECLAAPGEGAPGCRIRKLVPGSGLPLTQIGTVRFTARDIGATASRNCRDPL